MTKQLQESSEHKIWVNHFDEEDWAQMMKREPQGYSWHEEAYLAGDDYIEDGKEFLRCN